MEFTPATAVPIRRQREHILVVDDEDHIRFGLSLTLRKAGFQVMVANNGLNALEGLRSGRETFALMILDLRMPLMSGTSLLAVLATEGIQLPVIGITGCTEADAVARLESAGCVAVLSKPFTADAILGAVERVLAGHHPELMHGGRREVSP